MKKLRLFEDFSSGEAYDRVVSEIRNFAPDEIANLLRELSDIVSDFDIEEAGDVATDLRFAADKLDESQ